MFDEFYHGRVSSTFETIGRKGNAWNDFQRAHAGEGLSRGEASAMYRAESNAAPNPASIGGGGYNPSNAWNDFQHRYAGRGLSKDELARQYAQQKAPKPLTSWNQFQQDVGGTGLSKDQIRDLYYLQQRGYPARDKPPKSIPETKPASKPAPTLQGFGDFMQRAFDPSGFSTPPPPPAPISQPSADPVAKGVSSPFGAPTTGFTFGTAAVPGAPRPFGGQLGNFATAEVNKYTFGQDGFGLQSPPKSPFGGLHYKGYFQCLREQQTELCVDESEPIFLKYCLDSSGQERSPEELRVIYKFGRRALKVKPLKSSEATKQGRSKMTEMGRQVFVEAVTKATKSEAETEKTHSKTQVVQETPSTSEQPPPARERDPEPVDLPAKSKIAPESSPEELNQVDTPAKNTKASSDEADDKPKSSVSRETDENEADDDSCSKSDTFSEQLESESLAKSSLEEAASRDTVVLKTTDENRIAVGNYSSIYKATMNSETHVAAKVFPNVYSKAAVARSEREIAKLCKIPKHEHLVRYYGHVYHRDGEQVALLSELLPSPQTLRSRLYRSRNPLDENQKHKTLLDVLDALEVLHSQDVTHRDLSPSHVLLLPDSQNVKLIDYGIPTLKNAAATGSGNALGFTPAYASPELLRGGLLVDDVEGWKKSDVFSFTVLMVELLMEEQPWEGELPLTVINAVEKNGRRPFKRRHIRVFGERNTKLEDIVYFGWHEDPKKRPSAMSLLRKLYKVFCAS